MGLFTKSVMGISASKVPAMKEAITTYVSGIQDIIKRVEDKEATAGFKGEYAIAISNYVTNVKLVCTKIVAQLNVFCDKLDLIKAAYEASDTKLAETLASGKGSLLSEFNVSDAVGSAAIGGAAAAMAAGVNSSTPTTPSATPAQEGVSEVASAAANVGNAAANTSSTQDYSAAAENVKGVFQAAASQAKNVSGAVSEALAPGSTLNNAAKEASQAIQETSKTVVEQVAEKVAPTTGVAGASVDTRETQPQVVTEEPSTTPTENSTEDVKETVADETTNAETSSDSAPSSSSGSTESSNGVSMAVPDGDTSYKSYTSYRKVNSNTPQGAVVYGGTAPYGKYEGTTYNTQTDPDTGVRYVTFEGDDTKYYCAAMGTYYGDVGDTFKITTDEGNSYNVIMCDVKGSDAQGWRDGETWYHESGGKRCVTEFYIDTKQIPDEMKVSGGTTGTYDSVSQFSGEVIKVEKLS